MAGGVRTFDVEITRNLRAEDLDVLTEEAAEAGDDAGELGGNHLYQDLRGASWDQVRRVLEFETDLVRRMAAATDPSAAERRFEDERDTDPDNPEGLGGLDAGVAAATAALSALGATPFISCNAGSFGNTHQAAHPYVAFYISSASPDLLLHLAEASGVGLEARDGKGALYGRSILDLQRFARVAMDWAEKGSH